MTPARLREAIKDANRDKRHLGEAEIVLAAAPLLLELWEAAMEAEFGRVETVLADLEQV